MIHDTKFFEWIEDYCLENLTSPEKEEFETALINNSELNDEVNLENEIRHAITEKDVLNLREKLEKAAEQTQKSGPLFNLLEGFEDIREPEEIIPQIELLNFYDSLPKAHIYQHGLVRNENIHEFYREQNILVQDNIVNADEEEYADTDPEGLEDLGEALLETDIMNLRDALTKVSASAREQISTEEIDRYLNGELGVADTERIEHELEVNKLLRQEVKLHQELENAILEIDIMNLRNEISNLTESETSSNVCEEQMEEYLSGTLRKEVLQDFQNELSYNYGLRTELALRKNLEKAIGENDVIILRDKLHQIRQQVNIQAAKSVIPETKIKHVKWWKAAVAVAVLLFLSSNLFRSSVNTYNSYYQSPEWAPQRSVAPGYGILDQANSHYMNGEFDKAILLYDKAIQEVNEDKFVYHFYKAASLQKMEKPSEAIPEYRKVIEDGDNIFVEEAEWFKALCYLKMSDKKTARLHLLAIKNKKGFYANDAKAILRKTILSIR